nr:hypothetical protein [uncultured bacterium]QCO92820.1 hypothetical protein [uncultured bacterium]QCO92872.1 hypothetical protein [uncultured bacterium]QCO92897.1 hypothetical protein [uncultured bacterium]
MKQSIVLSTHSAQFNAVAFKGDLETNIAKIARWGYAGVELAIRDPRLVDAAELERMVLSNGLEMPAIGTGQAWGEERLSFSSGDAQVRAAAVERIQSHIPLAARFHAVIILGLIRGITPAEQSHAQSMRYLVECIRECAAAGASYGVRFALEPINRYETDLINTVAEGMELLEKVGEDNFGLLLDTFHMNIEEPRIEESIRICGDRLFHFHVADSNRWYPGAGHLDFKPILAALAATGYQGYISGEFLPKPDADTAAVQNSLHITRLLEKP